MGLNRVSRDTQMRAVLTPLVAEQKMQRVWL